VRAGHLDIREETPVSSNVEAFDLVRRESVWQRAGPRMGALPRETLAAPLVRQGRDGRRPTMVDLIPAARGDRGGPDERNGLRVAPIVSPSPGHSCRNMNPRSVTG
jgi:hypothetical protein